MIEAELLEYLGDDASKWAAEFCKIARDHGHDLDEGWMITWFANAIEHSYQVRMRRAEPRPKPTIAELEEILNSEVSTPMEVYRSEQ
jgi:hypothetical protein